MRKWIEDRLNKVNKRKIDLAKAINKDPARVTEIIAGRRRVQEDEVGTIAAFLEMEVADFLAMLSNDTSAKGSSTERDLIAFIRRRTRAEQEKALRVLKDIFTDQNSDHAER